MEIEAKSPYGASPSSAAKPADLAADKSSSDTNVVASTGREIEADVVGVAEVGEGFDVSEELAFGTKVDCNVGTAISSPVLLQPTTSRASAAVEVVRLIFGRIVRYLNTSESIGAAANQLVVFNVVEIGHQTASALFQTENANRISRAANPFRRVCHVSRTRTTT